MYWPTQNACIDSLVSSNCRAASRATTGSSPANWAARGETASRRGQRQKPTPRSGVGDHSPLGAAGLTEDAVSRQRLGLSLEVLDVVHLPVDDRPETAVLVVVLQVGLANEGNLLVVLGTLSCEEGSCHSRRRASYILQTPSVCVQLSV